MKILRSKGTSFTELTRARDGIARTGTDPSLSRGLQLKGETQSDRISPDELVNHIESDASLRIRQVISALDKVIQKRRRLTDFNLAAYYDRTRLAGALWQTISANADVAALHDFWLAKAHPYARVKFNLNDLEKGNDKNAQAISKAQKGKQDKDQKTAKREEFNGRWHDIFWQVGDDGQPDYQAIASAIIDHLDNQELILSDGEETKPRRKGFENTEKGLIVRRMESIVSGGNDPRVERKHEYPQWQEVGGEGAINAYFEVDVAVAIRTLVDDIQTRNSPLRASDVGQVLYNHFKPVLGGLGEDKAKRFEMWSLHNQVRAFYRKVMKSERFRRAVRALQDDAHHQNSDDRIKRNKEALKAREYKKLRYLFPKDRDALLAVLKAKGRNADFSEFIRLGKILVHATDVDLPSVQSNETQDQALQKRMDVFITSDGQSEIKRNESFVRVWRNSTGLSFQTLRTLTDVQEDLADNSYTCVAANAATWDNLNERLQLLFGNKEFEGGRRANIFKVNSDKNAKEALWSLLALAATVRHKTNHFMVKSRLIELITSGVVKLHSDVRGDIDNRRSYEVDQPSLDRFPKLLAFDEALQTQAIVDSLKAIKAEYFVDQEKLEGLVAQLARVESGGGVIVPRFMAMMRKAKNVQECGTSEWSAPLKGVASIELIDQEGQRSSHQCKIGLLRLLYNSGFQDWLQSDEAAEVDIQTWVTDLIGAKGERGKRRQKEEMQIYQYVEVALDETDLSDFDCLADLFKAIERIGTHKNGNSQRYTPDRQKQKTLNSGVEGFKQEIFAALFEEYLEKQDLNWIWDLPENSDATDKITDIDDLPRAIEAARNGIAAKRQNTEEKDGEQAAVDKVKQWAPQFYTWLYFLPPGTVSQLRHQFRKTLVLEDKGPGDTPIEMEVAFRELDRLMALYTRVQGAGFSGTERGGSTERLDVFYDDPAEFKKVFSQEAVDLNKSIAGTQRGLRELRRFGHIKVMTKLFSHHRVSALEVEHHSKADQKTVQAMFETKNALKNEIVERHKGDPWADGLGILCGKYREAVVKTALHDFSVRAARLEEHLRAHQLMMRVVGRLLDFTLMWERDQKYVLLGMLYRQWKVAGRIDELKLVIESGEDKVGRVVSLVLPAKDKDGAVELPLWSEHKGFDEDFAKNGSELLNQDMLDLYSEHFYYKNSKQEQHAKDGAWQPPQIYKDPGKEGTKLRNYLSGKQAIRNDFAHYNVVNRTGDLGPNLTYLTNSVRSLFSYDRKLKNAVSGAITRLLEKEGVAIEWELLSDRLKNPVVLPVVDRHLDFVRSGEGRDVPILIPRTSVRFVSMVKGLFEFDKRGYRNFIEEEGKQKRAGTLCYPDQFKERDGKAVPDAFYGVELPQSPSDMN